MILSCKYKKIRKIFLYLETDIMLLLTAAPAAPGRPLSPGRPRGPYDSRHSWWDCFHQSWKQLVGGFYSSPWTYHRSWGTSFTRGTSFTLTGTDMREKWAWKINGNNSVAMFLLYVLYDLTLAPAAPSSPLAPSRPGWPYRETWKYMSGYVKCNEGSGWVFKFLSFSYSIVTA